VRRLSPGRYLWTHEEIAKEEHSFHLGCFDSRTLLGTLVLTPLDSGTIKMRLVAVAEDVQGQGVGTTLVAFAEQFASERGFSRMTAHARDTAVPFYRKLGYSVEGDAFTQVSIAHFAISKRLAAPS
jgi:GNAT superfamily N-acetyltransferase